jgi:hypothetical protein
VFKKDFIPEQSPNRRNRIGKHRLSFDIPRRPNSDAMRLEMLGVDQADDAEKNERSYARHNRRRPER